MSLVEKAEVRPAKFRKTKKDLLNSAVPKYFFDCCRKRASESSFIQNPADPVSIDTVDKLFPVVIGAIFIVETVFTP